MTIQLSDGLTVRAVNPPQITLAPSVTPPGGNAAAIAVYVPGGATAGSTALTFTFSTPAATWTVTHGLGRHPLVQLIDATGDQIDADVEFPDLHTVVVTHAQPLAGSVLVV